MARKSLAPRKTLKLAHTATTMAADQPFRNAVIAILIAFPSSIVAEQWPHYIDHKPATLKKLLEAANAKRERAIAMAAAHKAEHRRRNRLTDADDQYPRSTQTPEQRAAFVQRMRGAIT